MDGACRASTDQDFLSRVKSVKDSIKLLMNELPVQRKHELIMSIERHMTATERGRHFFEVRKALEEMIQAGELITFLATGKNGWSATLVCAPGVSIELERSS